MKSCSVKPYEGKEPYVFVSYCHKDKAYVYPIVERMAQDGFRVWYDEGIDPGSEWPESIARHLNNSTICIAFFSTNALNSHNCRREVNFALLKEKPFVSVILEKIKLSLGMEMQLSANQAIFKYTLSSEAEFFQKLYSVSDLAQCHNTPAMVPPEPENHPDLPDVPRTQLTRSKTGEVIFLPDGAFMLGRSQSSHYVIQGNSMVGRQHAVIQTSDGQSVLMDNHSACGTFLNGQRLKPGQRYLLRDGDSIYLANEKFVFSFTQDT